jgi:hypothetical protein
MRPDPNRNRSRMLRKRHGAGPRTARPSCGAREAILVATRMTRRQTLSVASGSHTEHHKGLFAGPKPLEPTPYESATGVGLWRRRGARDNE